MKKAALTLLGLALLFAALVAVQLAQLARLDAGELAADLAQRAGAALGRPVRFGRAELHTWPLPALGVAGVRAHGGPAGVRLAVEELRLGLSPVALLAGKVVYTRIAIEDGSVESGPWRLARVEASGGLGLDLAATLELEAEAPGLGRLVDGVVELSGLAAGETGWSVGATLLDVDLAELARRTGLAAQVRGRAGLVLRAEGTGERLTGGQLELTVPDAGIHGGGFDLLGRVALEAELGGRWQLDLGGAELGLGDFLRKPLGEELVLTALVDTALPPREIREIRLRSRPLSADATLQLEDGGPRLAVEAARADLALLRPWWQSAWHPLSGAVTIHGGELAPAEGTLRVRGALAAVALPLPGPLLAAQEEAVVALDGPFAVEGSEIGSEGLSLGIADQRVALGGRFDVASRSFELQLEAGDLDVGRVLTALSGQAVLEGRLGAEASLSGGPELDSLRGSGHFELADGRIPEADFPWPVEAQDPRLTSGEEGREFDLLEGRFALADGSARFRQLSFWHPYLNAHLRGDVGLADGALDLRGELEISEELDAGLGGGGRRRTLPVRHVSGTLRDPRFDMDRDVLTATFRQYADNLRAEQQP
jgi:hypothetical protein